MFSSIWHRIAMLRPEITVFKAFSRRLEQLTWMETRKYMGS